MATKNETYWAENDDYIASALLELGTREDLERVEGWLKLGDARFCSTMEPKLDKTIHTVKRKKSKQGEIRQFKRKVEERQQSQWIDIALEAAADDEGLAKDEDEDSSAEESHDGDGR